METYQEKHKLDMAASNSPPSTILIQEITENFHSRKLLLQTLFHQSPTPSPSPIAHDPLELSGYNSFDAHVVMVLSVLLCALVCSLSLNSIIRCALRRSSSSPTDPSNNPTPRLADTGIKKKALKTFPIINYTPGLKLPGLDSECAICLSEFLPAERVRVLPHCSHGFHVRCIDTWLVSHSSCPSCRHCLRETCEKIVGSAQDSTSTPVPSPLQETIVKIAPLEPEGLIRTNQT